MKWSGVIAVEGEDSLDYRHLAEGSMVFPFVPLPLVGRSGAVIGAIKMITREGHLIRAEGTALPDTLKIGDPLAATTDGIMVAGPREDGTVVITAARLRQVSVTDLPIWAECVVETVGEGDSPPN